MLTLIITPRSATSDLQPSSQTYSYQAYSLESLPESSYSRPRFLAPKHRIFFFGWHRLLSISSFRRATFTEITLTYLRTEILCCRPLKHHNVGSGDDTLRRIMPPNQKLQKIFCFEKCELIPINVEPTAASAQLPDSFEGNHQPTNRPTCKT